MLVSRCAPTSVITWQWSQCDLPCFVLERSANYVARMGGEVVMNCYFFPNRMIYEFERDLRDKCL